jgi:hypothetical protein
VVANLPVGRRGRGAVVQLVRELVDRYDLVRANQQEQEDAPLSPTPELDRAVPADNFQRAEDAELHHFGRP